jgi:hypothetical protein
MASGFIFELLLRSDRSVARIAASCRDGLAFTTAAAAMWGGLAVGKTGII